MFKRDLIARLLMCTWLHTSARLVNSREFRRNLFRARLILYPFQPLNCFLFAVRAGHSKLLSCSEARSSHPFEMRRSPVALGTTNSR